VGKLWSKFFHNLVNQLDNKSEGVISFLLTLRAGQPQGVGGGGQSGARVQLVVHFAVQWGASSECARPAGKSSLGQPAGELAAKQTMRAADH